MHKSTHYSPLQDIIRNSFSIKILGRSLVLPSKLECASNGFAGIQ
jgi:hypothetical protein